MAATILRVSTAGAPQSESGLLHEGRRRYHAFLLRLLAREGVPPGSRLLEAGAGVGLFAAAAEEAGYRVTALEPAPGAAAAARARLRGPVVQTGFAERLELADGSFEAVTLLDVIEHIAGHRQALANAARLLVPGGLLVVVTLNAHSVLRPLLGRRWAWYQDPEHVHLFSPGSLRRDLLSAGFSIRRATTVFSFCKAGESLPALRPLRRLGSVWSVPALGDSLLVVAGKAGAGDVGEEPLHRGPDGRPVVRGRAAGGPLPEGRP